MGRSLLLCLLAPSFSLGLRLLGDEVTNFTALTRGRLPVWSDNDYWQDDISMREAGKNKPNYDNDFRREPRSRVLVVPSKKLAFCYIEKNACTQFNHLFNHMNGINQEDSWWWMSTMMNFDLDWSDVTRAKGWKWGVFLRDPLPRYLSAWGSKCMMVEDGGVDCMPRGMLSPGNIVDFEANVRANLNNPRREDNPHWARQEEFCGGLGDASGFDFVGLLRGDVNGQVRAFLEMAGAVEGASIESFFPKQGVKGHHSALRPARYYRDESVQRAVMGMYAEDYQLPGLSPHLIATEP